MEIVYNSIHHFFLYTRRKMAILFIKIFVFSSIVFIVVLLVLLYLICFVLVRFCIIFFFCRVGNAGEMEVRKNYISHLIFFMLLFFLYNFLFFSHSFDLLNMTNKRDKFQKFVCFLLYLINGINC